MKVRDFVVQLASCNMIISWYADQDAELSLTITPDMTLLRIIKAAIEPQGLVLKYFGNMSYCVCSPDATFGGKLV